MLDRLRGGSLTVTELARPYAMSLNAVSKHVKTLERAGLIRRSIKGREHSCRLDAARFDEAMNWMGEYSEFWSGRMDALANRQAKARNQVNSAGQLVQGWTQILDMLGGHVRGV